MTRENSKWLSRNANNVTTKKQGQQVCAVRDLVRLGTTDGQKLGCSSKNILSISDARNHHHGFLYHPPPLPSSIAVTSLPSPPPLNWQRRIDDGRDKPQIITSSVSWWKELLVEQFSHSKVSSSRRILLVSELLMICTQLSGKFKLRSYKLKFKLV